MTTTMIQETGRELDSYQREPVLTAAQERTYIAQAQRGDQGAIDHLVRANIGWIAKIAKTMPLEGVTLTDVQEDLIQEGCVGLIYAVHKFDLACPNRLNTYATWKIKQVMHRYLENTCTTIRLPVYLHPIKRSLKQAEKKSQDGQYDAALAAYPAQSVAEVRRATRTVQSLDALLVQSKSNNLTLGDLLADDAPSTEDVVLEEMQSTDIEAALGILNVRERRILRMHYGLDDGIERTLEDIGTREGVTRERVRQIEAAALAKLRQSRFARKWFA